MGKREAGGAGISILSAANPNRRASLPVSHRSDIRGQAHPSSSIQSEFHNPFPAAQPLLSLSELPRGIFITSPEALPPR